MKLATPDSGKSRVPTAKTTFAEAPESLIYRGNIICQRDIERKWKVFDISIKQTSSKNLWFFDQHSAKSVCGIVQRTQEEREGTFSTE